MNLNYLFDHTTKMIKHLFFLTVISLTMLTGCKNKNTEKTAMPQQPAQVNMPFYVGTYTDGNSEGIYKYQLSSEGKLSKIGLAAKTSNPSFLNFNKDHSILLAVNENDPGTVQSFSIKKDSLILLSESPSGGAHPCYISATDDGFVLTANYSSGNVGLLQLDDQGKLSDLLDVDQHTGKGSTERQSGPYAHFATFLPKMNKVAEVDLGTDQLWLAILNKEEKKLEPATPRTLDLPSGAGPRHFVLNPTKPFLYVLNELGSSITVVNMEQDSLKVVDTLSTLPKDYNEDNTGAELGITKDGKFLYASNRGLNSIAIFKVMEQGKSLKLLGNTSTKGTNPRNFSLSPDDRFLVAANQDSNSLVAFKRNDEDGSLTYVSEIDAPKPVCILFD